MFSFLSNNYKNRYNNIVFFKLINFIFYANSFALWLNIFTPKFKRFLKNCQNQYTLIYFETIIMQI